jgi:DNA-binding transcriptional ArsR family regulator
VTPDFLRAAGPHQDTASGKEPAPEVQVAVYDTPLASPRVLSVRATDFHEFVGDLAARTYNFSRERGGRIPFVVIREIIENLIHAYFAGAVISILDGGNTIRISDQGPGIADKVHAVLPGFTTATAELRRFIKGVGSGLPVAKETLTVMGGALSIEDNLARGTVITLRLGPEPAGRPAAPVRDGAVRPRLELTARQKKVLLLIAELGAAGPSEVAKALEMSQSTAYRELQLLSSAGLLATKRHGKRTLTEEGIASLDTVFLG